jgi:hypothetical protein
MCVCLYIYINMYFAAVLRGKIRKRKWKNDGADDPKSLEW